MFILPIRSEKDTIGYPNITIGLIVINLIIWVFTNNIVRSEGKYMNELHEQMVEIEQLYIRDFLVSNPDVMKMDYFEARKIILKEGVIPSNTPEYQEWLALYREFEAVTSNTFFHRWGFVPNSFNVLKLFFAMFLHGGFMHVFGNMLFLWIVGCNMEDDWGWMKFFGLYFAGGLVAAFFHWASDPGGSIPMIGASGAVAGVMGAFMIEHFKTKIRFFYFFWLLLRPTVGYLKIYAGLVLPFWFIIEYFSAKSGMQTGTAHWAHVGGFVLGGVLGLFAKFFSKEALMENSEKQVVSDNVHNLLLSNLSTIDYSVDVDISGISHLNEIIESEPYNFRARLALAKVAVLKEMFGDAKINYNRAVEIGLELEDDDTLMEIFNELKKDNTIKYLTDSHLYQVANMLERKHQFQSAAKLYSAYVKWFPSGILRAKSIYRAAVIFKNHLKDDKMATNAMALLRKEYPDFSMQTD